MAAALVIRAGRCDLNLRHFSWNVGFNNNQIYFLDRRPQPILRAGRKAEAQPIGSELQDAKKATESKKKVLREISSPPEKPLSGDCCGSGCIPCVWDLYYEELEEYNKLYKGGSNPKS